MPDYDTHSDFSPLSFKDYYLQGKASLRDGLYVQHLTSWLDVISREQLFITTTAALLTDTGAVARGLLEFLHEAATPAAAAPLAPLTPLAPLAPLAPLTPLTQLAPLAPPAAASASPSPFLYSPLQSLSLSLSLSLAEGLDAAEDASVAVLKDCWTMETLELHFSSKNEALDTFLNHPRKSPTQPRFISLGNLSSTSAGPCAPSQQADAYSLQLGNSSAVDPDAMDAADIP